MKNKAMKLLLSLLAAGALCMASCTDEEFVREAGSLPGEDALQGLTAELLRLNMIDPNLRLLDKDVEDCLRCRLSGPADKEMTLSLAVDQELADAYNAEHETDYPLFPGEKLTLLTQSSIARGERQADVRILFEREGVEAGTYLLPVAGQIDDQAVRQDPAAMSVCYVVQVYEPKPRTELDEYPFITVGYINTTQMNPLYADDFFYVTEVNMGPPMQRTNKTWLDLVPLRESALTLDAAGRVSLELGPDLQYVFHNREHYIVPIQRGGRKVLICINGCLRNLDDAQIAEAAYRIKKAVSEFQIDGVNFFDMGDSYDKPGAPAIIPSSYAKLIKTTKETLGDKLVTVTCDAASTGELAIAQQGIEAGQYIDFAWSGIFDKAVDAYAEDAELKPIAGLDRAKYGGVMLQAHTTSWNAQYGTQLTAEVKDFYLNQSESANVFAFWDMPTNQQGIESGPMAAFSMLTGAMRDVPKKLMYTVQNRGWGGNYGAFTKDW